MTGYTTTIRCGDTLHVLVAATADELARLADATAGRLLKPNGHAVVRADGRSSHVVDEELHPAEWNADGNRVRANRVRYERDAAGNMTATVLRQVWTKPC
jgi:YD repeat-containing protein